MRTLYSASPARKQDSAVSVSSEGQITTTASNICCDSLASWGADTPFDNAIDPNSHTDFPGIGAAVENKSVTKNRLCGRCRAGGRLAKNCTNNQAAKSFESGSTASTRSNRYRPNPVQTWNPAFPISRGQDLIEFSDEEEEVQASEEEVAQKSDEEVTLRTLKGKDDENHAWPDRAREWTDLDLETIRDRAKNEEAFRKPLTEPSLMDGGSLTTDDAARMAGAIVPVELKRKRKGRRGKAYYDLSPFINY